MLFSKNLLLKKGLAVSLFLLTFLTLLPSPSAQASVGLIYFHALPGTNHVKLEWETAQELNNFGFKIFRGLSANFDNAQQVNIGIIPADGSATGAYYEWIDNNIQIGTLYYYWLQDIDVNGVETEHGPESVTVTGGNTLPTVPSPGGGNSTATPTPTRTPTRTPTATVQAGSTAAPTQTPTRTPAAQPTLSNPTATTEPQVQSTAVINNQNSAPPVASQSAATAVLEQENELGEVSNTTTLTMELTTAPNDLGREATATPESLVQAASATDEGEDGGDTADGLNATQIGQGAQEGQETGTADLSDEPGSLNRSTLITMALIASVVLLFIGGGGIIVLVVNRSKDTRL